MCIQWIEYYLRKRSVDLKANTAFELTIYMIQCILYPVLGGYFSAK